MQALRQTDSAFLSYVAAQEPQGAFLKQIADALKLSIQNAYRYARKLSDDKKKLLRKDERGLYHLTEQGFIALNAFRGGSTQPNPKPLSNAQATVHNTSKPLQAQAPAEQSTNLHAFQVHYKPFPTYYSRLEATLGTLNIAYKATGNSKHHQYIVSLGGGIMLQLGSKQIIAWGPELDAPINVDGQAMQGKALEANISAVAGFLAKTGIRCWETIDHRLYAEIRYKELAIRNNDAAERTAKDKGYIPLAYDRTTQRCSIWLDGTPAPAAFETNSLANHAELRSWAQGIEDGVIKPYSDEMQHRERINELTDLLLEYGKQLNRHLPILELAEYLLKDSKSRKARVAKPYVDENQTRLAFRE